jgi:hypothetical protein
LAFTSMPGLARSRISTSSPMWSNPVTARAWLFPWKVACWSRMSNCGGT